MLIVSNRSVFIHARFILGDDGRHSAALSNDEIRPSICKHFRVLTSNRGRSVSPITPRVFIRKMSARRYRRNYVLKTGERLFFLLRVSVCLYLFRPDGRKNRLRFRIKAHTSRHTREATILLFGNDRSSFVSTHMAQKVCHTK